ncbi:inner membrane protein, partial [Escherichia coli]
MRAIGKLPKSVLILEFIGMMLLAVALLSVSDSLSLPEPFSRPEVQILMIFLGVLLMLPAAVVVIPVSYTHLDVYKRSGRALASAPSTGLYLKQPTRSRRASFRKSSS